MIRKELLRHAGTATLAAALALSSTMAYARPGEAQQFELAAQDLDDALREVSARTGRNLIVSSELLAGRRSPALRGRYTPEGAIEALLAGSGLALRVVDGSFVVAEAPLDSAGEEKRLTDALVVTGTRIRGAAPVGSDVVTIDREDIERSGYATTQDIAQTIPQNFGGAPNEATVAISLDPNSGRNVGSGSSLNLRGLGNASTLVLLNGDRPAQAGSGGLFSDISIIPASAIERIEIVADGSSAIYGSDAVAGVVNVIPRLRFRGAETTLRFGTADGDTTEILAAQLLGTGWSSGSAVIAYEYFRRSALPSEEREFVTDDLRPFGGPDQRGSYASPGTIVAGGRTFAIPSGQDGTNLSAGDLLADAVNPGDSWSLTDILPKQSRHSVFAAASQDLGPVLRLYGHGLFSTRSFSQRDRTAVDSPRTVPVTNPFYVDPLGTSQPVAVRYDFGEDLGRERRTGRVEAYALALGLGADLGRWSADLRGTIGHHQERTALLNRVNGARLALALADTDPATAYNLFGDGPSTNPATIDFIRGSSRSGASGSAWSATFRADGPLVTLPAGDLRVAFGGEYRRERYRNLDGVRDTSTLEPVIIPATVLPGARRIRALYAEALLPVFGEDFTAPGLHRLDLSAAIRTERYSDFGTTTNPKFGVNWEPVRGVRLRASYGTSFRAPAIDNLRQDAATILLFAFTIPDPASPTGASSILVRRGNDPDLQPERATTWSVGLDLEPALLPGLRANLTYYNIAYRDRITSPAANLFNFLVNRETYQGIITDNPSPELVQSFYSSPFFINPLGVAPEAISAVVDAQLQNLSVVEQSGIDLDIGYSFAAFGGRAELGASGAYILNIDQALTPSAPPQDVVDVLGNPVDLRLRARALWNGERWGGSLFVNYLDSYTNLTNVEPQKVSSWTTLDAQVSYRIPDGKGPLSGLRFALSATNLLDRDPPYAAYNLGILVTGFDPDNASPVGRVVSLQVTKAW